MTKSQAVHLSSCFSLHLTIEKYNFLGISIVGQSNEKGDGGIYIGSIMKGGCSGCWRTHWAWRHAPAGLFDLYGKIFLIMLVVCDF